MFHSPKLRKLASGGALLLCVAPTGFSETAQGHFYGMADAHLKPPNRAGFAARHALELEHFVCPSFSDIQTCYSIHQAMPESIF
jgi:hypothetical protein